MSAYLPTITPFSGPKAQIVWTCGMRNWTKLHSELKYFGSNRPMKLKLICWQVRCRCVTTQVRCRCVTTPIRPQPYYDCSTTRGKNLDFEFSSFPFFLPPLRLELPFSALEPLAAILNTWIVPFSLETAKNSQSWSKLQQHHHPKCRRRRGVPFCAIILHQLHSQCPGRTTRCK